MSVGVAITELATVASTEIIASGPSPRKGMEFPTPSSPPTEARSCGRRAPQIWVLF
jgi:hypothetical protein